MNYQSNGLFVVCYMSNVGISVLEYFAKYISNPNACNFCLKYPTDLNVNSFNLKILGMDQYVGLVLGRIYVLIFRNKR